MKVKIAEPCSENWDLMTPKEKGRHCSKCNKTVTDFRKKDNFEIVNHLYTNTNSCGRFYDFQLNKDLKLPVLHNPWISWLKKLALGSAFLGGVTNLKGQDTLQTDTVLESVIPINSTVVKNCTPLVINGSVEKDSIFFIQLESIRFTMDTFEIIIPKDSLKSFSFQVPNGIIQDTIVASFVSKTETSHLNILVNWKTMIINFLYTDKWTYTTCTPFNFDVSSIEKITSPEVQGGFWEPEVIGFKLPKINVHTLIIDSFDISLSPTIGLISQPLDETQPTKILPKIDTILLGDTHPKEEEQFKDYLVYKKRKSSIWWWLIPAGIITFLGLYFWKRKKK